MSGPADPELDAVRLDRWLWTARMFRTRSLAARAVRAGRVRVNDQRPKPGSSVRVGDRVRVRKPPYDHHLVVRGLAERRGPAAEAARLYEETEESRAARERRAIQMKNVPVPRYDGKGRPTKKERREIERFRPDPDR